MEYGLTDELTNVRTDMPSFTYAWTHLKMDGKEIYKYITHCLTHFPSFSSQYLECYLWPNFDPKVSSKEHLMSIVVIVNEKFRERVPAWTAIKSRPEIFPGRYPFFSS